MNITKAQTDGLARAAGAELSRLLKKHAEKEVFLLLAGGSCVAALEYVPEDMLGPHLTIGPLDDRFSFDPAVNNLMQLKTTGFYKRCLDADVNVADMVPTEGEAKEELAARYDEILHEWRAENPQGIFLGLFGVGEDGHVGSIMPFPENPRLFSELFDDKKVWVVAYDAGSKNQYPLRMTATTSFVGKNIAGGVAYVVGAKKRNALQKVLADEGELSETPARILRVIPEVTLFTDQEV